MKYLAIDDINFDSKLSAWIAAQFVRDWLYIWEERFPNDYRPQKAIEVAEEYFLNLNPNLSYFNRAAGAAQDAYNAASDASEKPDDIDSYAAHIADAACAAADAVAEVSSAKFNFNLYAADSAAYAAEYAYGDVGPIKSALSWQDYSSNYIQNMLIKHLTLIIDYKIKNNQSFANLGAVFEAASDEDKEKLLFHLSNE